MKKAMFAMILLFAVLAAGCSDSGSICVKIPVSQETDGGFIYSQCSLSFSAKKVTVRTQKGIGDTEVVLLPVGGNAKREYKPSYLTPGMSVTIETETGVTYKIGVRISKDSAVGEAVYLNIRGGDITVE